MNLPTPNTDEVARFQALYQAEFGVELSAEEALEQATRLVHYIFLIHHALPSLRAQKQ